jgi:hypothetical protein
MQRPVALHIPGLQRVNSARDDRSEAAVHVRTTPKADANSSRRCLSLRAQIQTWQASRLLHSLADAFHGCCEASATRHLVKLPHLDCSAGTHAFGQLSELS